MKKQSSRAKIKLVKHKRNPGVGGFKRCVKAVAARGTAASPRGVCAAQSRKKYGAKKFQAMAAKGRRKAAKRRNPAEAAAATHEFFHGIPPDKRIEVRKVVKEHTVLSGIGKLVQLVIAAIDGVHEVRLENFKGAMLAQNEKRTQLFIEGGDQSVRLADFGIAHPHEKETLGTIVDIVYQTKKAHLRPEDGGDGKLHKFGHQFGTKRQGDRHVKIVGSRLPLAVYDVRNKTIEIVGGTYDLPEVGISG